MPDTALTGAMMLLLTVEQWIGPGRNYPDPTCCVEVRKTVAFASRRKLEEAILFLANYEISYNRKYSLAVNFRLLSVSEIDDLSDNALQLMKVELAESLSLGD